MQHLPLLILPRLTVLCAPGSRSVHVSLRLSIGRRVGDVVDGKHIPSNPDDDAWPLPTGSQPEYPIECILDERVSPTRGLQFRVKWLCTVHTVTWEPASALSDTAALATWLIRARGEYTVSLRGDSTRLNAVLALPQLPPSRMANLRSLLASMDPHGIISLKPTYPNSTGNVVGGRTVYYDTQGKGNIFLSCHELIRAYVFGEFYDEVDITRSHISSVLGCWDLTGRPPLRTRTRMASGQAELEDDIARELFLMYTSCQAELDTLHTVSQWCPHPEPVNAYHVCTQSPCQMLHGPKTGILSNG